jgi:aspartyl-tRNA(Asn)/glutamyl-tRNA(Gln) amidotransferase subunit C
MAEITPEEVRHVAELAKLALSDEELARVGNDLNRILAYFRELQEVDTDNVPITSHAIPMLNVWREDQSRPSLPVEETVANAPDGVDVFFRVPRIIEE